MDSFDEFRGRFDAQGHLIGVDDLVAVVFATRGGSRFPGRLEFRDGLCVRAAMDRGGEWTNEDGSPLRDVRFLLDFGGDTLQAVAIDQGRLVEVIGPRRNSSRGEFLLNLRVARNLFGHPRKVESDSDGIDADATSSKIARAAIWLTPGSVAGFDPADFPELTPARRDALSKLIRDFKAVAGHVPPDGPATDEQIRAAGASFAKILEILGPHLPITEEARRIELALREVDFPPWIVNWDYELDSDSEGADVAWVSVFADEKAAPMDRLGRASSDMTRQIRQAFDANRVDRRPHVRMRTALEHKTG